VRPPPAHQSADAHVGQPTPVGGLTLVDVRRLWPDIVEATKLRRRVAWMHLTQNSQVVAVDAQTLTLGFSNSGARDSFLAGGCDEILRQAAIDVVGTDWRVETIVDPGAQPTAGRPVVASSAAVAPPTTAQVAPEQPASTPSADAESVAAARGAIQQTRPSGPGAAVSGAAPVDDDAHPDDPDADTGEFTTAELLRRELGAEVIDEIPHT
jgi:DNA polymerase-3 subunit gamma/tau